MKRLSKILCISVIAAIQLTLKVDAQTKFHDVELNDAAGPVKEMTINLGISKNTFKFSRNGKIEQYEGLVDTVYDEYGYLTLLRTENNGIDIILKVKWEGGRVKDTTMEMMGGEIKTTRIYNSAGCPIKEVSQTGETLATYSDYKYDSHGNWISRKAMMGDQTINQSRTIVYYE